MSPDATSSAAERARLRRVAAEKYRPERVNLLLVAHAPPQAPDRYFYFEDVANNDNLFRYVCKGLFGSKPPRTGKAALLARLCAEGVFLVDLLGHPYSGDSLTKAVPDLVERCTQLQPEHVVLIKADVFDAAYKPLVEAGIPVLDQRIPFPGSGRQREFEVRFAAALTKLGWNA